MVDARIVANRFIQLAADQGEQLTPMQLIKLVYIAHGWMLGLTGKPLIAQPVEAWQYGPVIREVYDSVRSYGRGGIEQLIPILSDGELNAAEDSIVRQVYTLYGSMDGIALSRITHMPNTPWASTYAPGSFGNQIPNALIADYYRQLSRERADPVVA